nr:hypothetical protein [Tanacetum cinerariifolium]
MLRLDVHTIELSANKPEHLGKSIARFTLTFSKAARFKWMTDTIQAFEMDSDIRFDGEYQYMAYLPKPWRDACKAANLRIERDKVNDDPKEQKPNRTIDACKKLTTNSGYAIAALDLRTI